MNAYNFVKVGAAVPLLKVADCTYNVDRILEIITEAKEKDVNVLAFPELCITGYTCGDLFHQEKLLKQAEEELYRLVQSTSYSNILIMVGLPLKIGNQKFNCAVIIKNGEILGVVPKTHLPNYNEFYEKRWFSSGENCTKKMVTLCYQDVPFGTDLIFKARDHEDLAVAVEICEDLWTVIPPSSFYALNGATIILNPSASNELVGKYEYRKSLVQQQSARCVAGYIYTSAGMGESTTDVVFSGSAMIAENGYLLKESERFSLKNELIISEFDIEYLCSNRTKNTGFTEPLEYSNNHKEYRTVLFTYGLRNFELTRFVNPLPFVPGDPKVMSERCQEILSIQSSGLMKRMMHIGNLKTVIGISGGLDSTLALLVMIRAYDKLNIDRKNIIGITMPGFGTTGRTYNNALKLMEFLGITTKEISIKDACIQHFKDIDVEENVHDVTYENSQARERTQILMDYANKENGFVVGTGDLSELALGWATYNGDHMSMYSVNGSIPKTLVRYLVEYVANEIKNSNNENEVLASEILLDIINTPISPELLPPTAEGEILQKTEEIVGNYDLNDFFLFQVVKCGFSPKKIFYLAQIAFKNKYEKDYILKFLKVFYKRFFTQQFKRSCLPDGVKVGSISLSPRGDWRMPSDASYNIWLKDLENL
jgi:NAD+ synthase (glutamine-hydrolysing)